MANNQLLRSAFPKWFEGGGIFAHMEDAPWQSEIDGVTLDIEYFGNRSGYKFCAPLVYNFLNEKGEVSDNGQSALARVILARYRKPWERLWNLLLSQYDPLDNYSLTEEVDMTNHASGKDKNNTSNKTEGSITTDRTGTDENKATGTESTSRSGQNTSKDTTTQSDAGNASRSGYNSTTPVTVNGHSTSSSATVNHVEFPNDKSIHEQDLTDTRTLNLKDTDTHDLTNTIDGTVERDHTTTDRGTRKRTGIAGMISRQHLVEQERQAWQWDFFDTVFADVDQVLALSVYDPCVMQSFDYTGGGSGSTYVLPIATNSNLGGVRAPAKTTGTVQVQVDAQGFLFVPPSSEIKPASDTELGGIKLPHDPTGDGEEISTKNAMQYIVDKTLSPEGSYKNDDTVSVVIPYASTTPGLVKGPSKTNETQQVALSSDGTMWVPQSTGGGSAVREVVNTGSLTEVTVTINGLHVTSSTALQFVGNEGKTIHFTYSSYDILMDVDKVGDNYIGYNFRAVNGLGINPPWEIFASYITNLSVMQVEFIPLMPLCTSTSKKISVDGYCNVTPTWGFVTALLSVYNKDVLISDGEYLFNSNGIVFAKSGSAPDITKLTVTINSDGKTLRFSKPE